MGFDEAAGVRSGAALVATTEGVADDARRCVDLGIQQLTFDFRTRDVDVCIRTMERFAERAAERT
jgi:hypothetical protein